MTADAPLSTLADAPAPTVGMILGVVGDAHGLTRAELRAPRRDPKTVAARSLAMWLARRLTTASYPMIGRACGGFDHTTVMAAVQRVETLVRTDAGFAARVAALEAECLADAAAQARAGLRPPADIDAEQVARRVAEGARQATRIGVAEVEALAAYVLQAAATQAIAEADGIRQARRRERRALAGLARARARLRVLADRVIAFEAATRARAGTTGEDAVLARQAQAEAWAALIDTQAATARAARADQHEHGEDGHGED